MGCAHISEHGPHLLKEGHGWGWCWADEGGREGGVEVEEVEVERSTNKSCDCVMPSPPTITGMPPTRCPSPLMRDVGLSA